MGERYDTATLIEHLRDEARKDRECGWPNKAAKKEQAAEMLAATAPKSLLRPALKPGDKLVCYCPPGICQAPKGFSGPCNANATREPKLMAFCADCRTKDECKVFGCDEAA